MLNRNIPIPLYVQLADGIKRKIEQGFYEINEKIPSEKELMLNYSVGRATVREAITNLVNEGYLEKRQGIGTFVQLRNKNLGFEPMISLAYLFKGRGYNYFNKVMEEKIIPVPDDNNFRWSLSKAHYIKRERYVDGDMIAVEEFYSNPNFKELTSDYNYEESMGKLMVDILKLPIKKISQDITMKEITDEDRELFKINIEEKIIILDRWIYIKGYDEPYQYYQLTIPLNLTSHPFVNI